MRGSRLTSRSRVAAIAAVLVAPLLAVPTALGEEPVDGECRMHAGIFSSEWESTEDLDAMTAWAGRGVSLAGTFHDVDENDDAEGSNTEVILERVWEAGTVPVMHLQISSSASQIALGIRDADIRDWATHLRGWLDRGDGRAVVISLLPEMNGEWVPYGIDPDNFVPAYRRARQLILDAGLSSSSVRWAFAPNNVSNSSFPMADYYPGDDVVDILGLSAFNFGTDVNEDGLFHDVHRVLDAPLRELKAVAPSKPVLLSEVGTSGPGGDTERWVADLVHHATADPSIVGIVYFNFDKEADFRVWDGEDGSEAWRAGITRATTQNDHPLDDWFQPGALPFVAPDFTVRHAGETRIETAVELSRYAFPSADVAVIAHARGYADALAGAPLAATLDAPLLLTETSSLSPAVIGELARLGVSRAVVLGGEQAVSPTVIRQLGALGVQTERVSGPNRFATAVAVANEIGTSFDNVFVVEGQSPDPLRGFPDAVSIAGVAGFVGQPVLLVTRDQLPAETAAALARLRPATVTIVGGPVAVSSEVELAIANLGPRTSRLQGATRYGTSAAVADYAASVGMDTHTVWLATGDNYPDALAAGPVVARCIGILLLVDGENPGQVTASNQWIQARRGTHIQLHVLGGEVAISGAVESQIVRDAR